MKPLAIVALTAALLAGTAAARDTARPPNVVIILIDDLGWKDVGCNGSTFYETPHIDRLAASGMRFTQGYAACPVCSPTRASIVTGKYPARLHLTDWLPGRADMPSQKLLRPKIRPALPLEEVTLAEALKKKEYVCAAIGKWHLGGKGFGPTEQGFDLNIAGAARGSPPAYFYPYKNQRDVITDLVAGGKEGEYLTDRLTSEAEKFIEKHRDRPFFLYLAHHAVHIPLQAKEAMMAKYRAKPGPAQGPPVYAAMIESVDQSVGRVLKKLEELKIDEQTVVIFTSDNGGLAVKEGPHTPATSNAPLRDGKGTLYEGGIRVPWLIRWPGAVKPGSVCNVPVSSIDFFPTLCEIAGVPLDPKQPVDGLSLVPLLKQVGALKRDALFWHYPHYSNQYRKPGSAVRQGDFKLIEFFDDNRFELYNVVTDLSEKTDLAAQMPEKTAALKKLLADWRKSVDAQMMTPNPNYKPAGK